MAIYHNVTGSTGVDVELIAPKSGVSDIKSILITNTHASAAATVTLFIEDDPTAAAASIYKILSLKVIARNDYLLLDNASMINFDNNTYGLYVTVGSSDTLDIMINT
tara:strand:+ start:365 stop:685 length:321 start_codon:yes stop_codon:yes gene_type:complete